MNRDWPEPRPGLFRRTSSLVDHAHRTLDEGERTLTAVQADLRKIRDVVGYVAVLAYIAAVASACTFIMLEKHLRRSRAS